VARRQLRAAGLTPKQIDRRISTGVLFPLHRAVYAIGHDLLSQRGRWLAAVLACGPKALLSHRSAAALHGLLPAPGRSAHVTAARTTRRSSPGIRVHRARHLREGDRALIDRIPVTSVARTLMDLAVSTDHHTLARAFEEADRLRILRLAELEELRARSHGHHGMRLFDAVLSNHTMPADLLSELEKLFLELCQDHAIPAPSSNVLVEGHKVDFHWHAERVVVELDGWAYHRTRVSHERDHAQTTELELAGYEVLRFTYRQVTDQPDRVIARVRRALTPP
jgi:hypothetical protein